MAAKPKPSLPLPSSKICCDCKVEKLINEFYSRPSRKDGIYAYCKVCCSNQAKKGYLQNKNKIKNRVKIYSQTEAGRLTKRKAMLKKYGLTPNQEDAMMASQNGLCFICEKPETDVDKRTGKVKKLCVDHKHSDGRVRKILCHACNKAIGLFKESASSMRKAAEYVERE